MTGNDSARVPPNLLHRIEPGSADPTDIELDIDQIGIGPIHEVVIRDLPVDRKELDMMVVISEPHSARTQLRCYSIELD